MGFLQIYRILELLAWVERGDPGGWDLYRLAGLGIPAGPLFAHLDFKCPETHQLHIVPGAQSHGDGRQRGVHCGGAVLFGELGLIPDPVGQFTFV